MSQKTRESEIIRAIRIDSYINLPYLNQCSIRFLLDLWQILWCLKHWRKACKPRYLSVFVAWKSPIVPWLPQPMKILHGFSDKNLQEPMVFSVNRPKKTCRKSRRVPWPGTITLNGDLLRAAQNSGLAGATGTTGSTTGSTTGTTTVSTTGSGDLPGAVRDVEVVQKWGGNVSKPIKSHPYFWWFIHVYTIETTHLWGKKVWYTIALLTLPPIEGNFDGEIDDNPLDFRRPLGSDKVVLDLQKISFIFSSCWIHRLGFYVEYSRCYYVGPSQIQV